MRFLFGQKKRPYLVGSFVAILLTGLAAKVTAFNIFDGSSLGESWNLGSNWSANSTPQPSDGVVLNSSSLAFGSASTLDASYTFQTLSFDTGSAPVSIDANRTGTTAQALTLNGGVDALGASGNLIDLSSTTTGAVNIGTNTTAGTLNVMLGANGAFNIGNASAVLNFGSNSIISGASNFSLTGEGTLILAGANSFDGSGHSFTLGAGATLCINNAS